MVIFRGLVVILCMFSLVHCATKEKSAPPPDVVEDTGSINSETSSQDGLAPGETSEKDLNSQLAQSDEFSGPGDADVPPPLPEESTPPPANIENSQSTPPPEISKTDVGAPAVVTALDFLANENGGTVVVKTNREVSYKTRRNDKNNQFVIELENTKIPSKFLRPLNTKEFPGAVASVNAYESKGAQNSARIVLQLRESVEPSVSQNGKSISVATAKIMEDSSSLASKGSSKTDQVSENSENDVPSENTDSEGVSQVNDKVMDNKSFEGFLLGQSKFYGRKISIEVTNQDIREVFKFISEESGLNIILDEDVTGKVTMKLKKAPWDQILAILLQSKQLGYVRNGTILRIATLKTLAADSQSARHVIDAQSELQPIRVQIFPMSYAKVEDFSPQITGLLSTRGKMSSDKRTNTLIVSDTAEVLSKVKALVTKLDTQTPQVLIEAKIIEAKDTFSRAVGVNWGAKDGSTNIGQGAGTNRINLTGVPDPTSGLMQPMVSSSYNTAGTTSLGLQIGSLDVLGNLSATLQLLETENLIKLISSPRVVVLDRSEASIEQTTSFPVVTNTPATSTSPAITTVTYKDIKLELKVTPQITVDGGVIMAIEITRELEGVAVSGFSSIERRHAKSQVLVESGDTVVIGGIYNSEVNNQEDGIPLLSKIPVLGALFRRDQVRKTKNELVMFLTPSILNSEKAFVKTGPTM